MIKGRCSTCKYFKSDLLKPEDIDLFKADDSVGKCVCPGCTGSSISVTKSYAYPEDPDRSQCGWWLEDPKLTKVSEITEIHGFMYKGIIYQTRSEAESKARLEKLAYLFALYPNYDILRIMANSKEKREAVIKILTEEM